MSIVATQVGKSIGDPPTHILRNISLTITDGEFVALTGRSGSGKSTLLYLLSTLDTVSHGTITIDQQDVRQLTGEPLQQLRNRQIGFIFQSHYLLAELSALENVLLPTHKTAQEESLRGTAEALLQQCDLGDKMHRLPRQLSGGEQQRVAIARALVMQPKYLFADEPTGSLDTVNGENVMEIICQANRQHGTTIILVTHDPDFAQLATRQIHLVDGQIVG